MRAIATGDMRRFGILFKRVARYHFYKDQMRTSDFYFQYYLKVINRTPSSTIYKCHKREEPWESQLERWRSERDKNFKATTRQEALNDFNRWMLHENKHQIAFEMTRLAATFKLKTCLELGCHAGGLMGMTSVFLRRYRRKMDFIGIEPDQMPVEVGAEQLKAFPIKFIVGDHERLKKLYRRRFGLMVCSFVLCLNEESVVREILEFAAKTCRFLLIAEDLSNMFESKPVIRRHYIVHNYAKLLKEYNFMIMDKIFLEDANEAANGILISANCN